jgi:hypothetical protein
MRKGTAVQIADLRRFYRSVGGSIGAAAIFLALDAGVSGSSLWSIIFCPVWILVSALRSAIRRPGWGLALARILIPVLTLWLVRANDAFQLRLAEANGQRIVAACEEFQATSGRFPKTLDELVPKYMKSVPVAKYCLLWGNFIYVSHASRDAMLYWHIVPPHYRKIYWFETRSWSYLD